MYNFATNKRVVHLQPCGCLWGSLPRTAFFLISTATVISMLNYIPIPTNLHMQSGVLSMLMKEGAHGYGVFLLLMQLARDAEGRVLANDSEQLAWAIHEVDSSLVERVIHNYGLFELTDGQKLAIPTLTTLMSEYDTKKEAARAAGRKGAASRYATTTLQQPHSNPIATLQQPHSNITLHNSIEQNETKSRSKLLNEQFCGIPGDELVYLCKNDKLAITPQIIKNLQDNAKPNHTPYFLAEMCQWFGVTQAILNLLLKWTDLAACNTARYSFIIKLQKEAEKANFRPKYPNEYIIAKCVEFDKTQAQA